MIVHHPYIRKQINIMFMTTMGDNRFVNTKLIFYYLRHYACLIFVSFSLFFFADFFLHDTCRTPAPIVFKLMSVIKDGLVNSILRQSRSPDQLLSVYVLPIHKKGKYRLCKDNYRGITITPTVSNNSRARHPEEDRAKSPPERPPVRVTNRPPAWPSQRPSPRHWTRRTHSIA